MGVRNFYNRTLWNIIQKNDRVIKPYNGDDYIFNELSDFFYPISPKVSLKHVEKHSIYSWVGAQLYKDKIFFIPSGEDEGLSCNKTLDDFSSWITVSKDQFKWSGGGIYKDALYCFPRSANSVLKYKNGLAEYIPLKKKYHKQHHYGGIITNDGILYQPPRNTDHILKVNLNTGDQKKIYISPRILHLKLAYCGSILHPNGLIYFFPENNSRVICLDPYTDSFSFIGDKISSMCFDAVVWKDKNIYGFSAYGNGILKIDPDQRKCEMIHKNKYFGSYGTKLGVNGKLYSVPGDGMELYEYDPDKDSVKAVYHLGKGEAKCAGAAIDEFGSYYLAPAYGDKIYKLSFGNDIEIPHKLRKIFFEDFY